MICNSNMIDDKNIIGEILEKVEIDLNERIVNTSEDRRNDNDEVSSSPLSSLFFKNNINKMRKPVNFRNMVLKAFNIKSLLNKARSKPKLKAVHLPMSIRFCFSNDSGPTFILINSLSLLKIKQQMENKPICFTYVTQVPINIFKPRNTGLNQINRTNIDSLTNRAKEFVSSLQHLPLQFELQLRIRHPKSFPINANGNDTNIGDYSQLMPSGITENGKRNNAQAILIDKVLLPSQFRVNALSTPDDAFPIEIVNAKIKQFIANDYEKQRVIINIDDPVKDNPYTLIAFPQYYKLPMPINNSNGTFKPIPLSFKNIEIIQPDVLEDSFFGYLPTIDYSSSELKRIMDYQLRTITELNDNGIIKADNYKQRINKIIADDKAMTTFIDNLKHNLNDERRDESHHHSLSNLIQLLFSDISSFFDYISSLNDRLKEVKNQYETKFDDQINECTMRHCEINESIDELRRSITKLKEDNEEEELQLQMLDQGIDFKQRQLETITELLAAFDVKTLELMEGLLIQIKDKESKAKRLISSELKPKEKSVIKPSIYSTNISPSHFYSNKSLQYIIERNQNDNKQLSAQLKQLQTTYHNLGEDNNNDIDNNTNAILDSSLINNQSVNQKNTIKYILLLVIIILIQIVLLFYLNK